MPQTYVAFARKHLDIIKYNTNKTVPRVCTVVGFPHGNVSTNIKMAETIEAIDNGAKEIDMVINLGWVKEGKFDRVLNEINMVKQSCQGKTLKVIVETCYLSEEEKKKLCSLVSCSSADYIKTSTGFGTNGATYSDVSLMAKFLKNKKIKAAGGIHTVEDAKEYLKLGADRLGTSSILKNFTMH